MTITIEWRYNNFNVSKDRLLSSMIQVTCLKLAFVVIHLLRKKTWVWTNIVSLAKLNACLTNGCHYCCIAEMEKSGNELLQSHLKPEEEVSRKSSVIVATNVLTKLRRHAKLIKEKRGMSFKQCYWPIILHYIYKKINSLHGI